MPKTAKKPKLGKIYKRDAMFFRVSVGTAKSEAGNEYELDINTAGSEPIVSSKVSGKHFILSWKDIITLAIQAGIDNMDKEAQKKRPARKKTKRQGK